LFGKPIYTAGGFLSRPFRTSCGISLDSAVQYLWFDSICCLGLQRGHTNLTISFHWKSSLQLGKISSRGAVWHGCFGDCQSNCAGRREELQEREKSAILYEHVKSEVARGLDYLRVLIQHLFTQWNSCEFFFFHVQLAGCNIQSMSMQIWNFWSRFLNINLWHYVSYSWRWLIFCIVLFFC
jgi:hypothetical protein